MEQKRDVAPRSGKKKKRFLLSTDTTDKQTGNVGYGWSTDMHVLLLYSCDHGEPTAGGLQYSSNNSVKINFYSSSFLFSD